MRPGPLGFVSPLRVELVSESPRLWKLTEPLLYRSAIFRFPIHGRASSARVYAENLIAVPPGFLTDFGSVPRMPLAWLLAGDTATAECALHDWLYTIQFCDRAQADAVFLEAMEFGKINRVRRRLMYRFVRGFGWSHWDPVIAEQRQAAADLLASWVDDMRKGPAVA